MDNNKLLISVLTLGGLGLLYLATREREPPAVAIAEARPPQAGDFGYGVLADAGTPVQAGQEGFGVLLNTQGTPASGTPGYGVLANPGAGV